MLQCAKEVYKGIYYIYKDIVLITLLKLIAILGKNYLKWKWGSYY